MLWVLGTLLGTFIGETLFFLIIDSSYERVILNITWFFTIFLIIFVGVALSTYLPQKKRERQILLMLPTTNLEKWLALLLNITIVWPIAAFLAFVIGDSLRMVVVTWLFDQPLLSGVPKVVHYLSLDTFSGEHMIWPDLFFSSVILLWLHSWFTLGGTFFRRYAFIIQSVLLIMGIICLVHLFKTLGLPRGIFRTENGQFIYPVWGYSACMLFMCCSILNYWLSFHIFKNYELTTNKWINYDIFKR